MAANTKRNRQKVTFKNTCPFIDQVDKGSRDGKTQSKGSMFKPQTVSIKCQQEEIKKILTDNIFMHTHIRTQTHKNHIEN